MEYLGHCISSQGVATDSSKIMTVQNWYVPHTLMHLKGFLGLTSYYHHFIARYATLAWPLTKLLKKGAFVWDVAAQDASETLKNTLSSTPVLALLDFTVSFVVERTLQAWELGLCSCNMISWWPTSFMLF